MCAKRRTINTPVSGISRKTTLIKHEITATIKSRTSPFIVTLDFLVLPQITGNMPSITLETKGWNLPQNIQLADPHFYAPQKIDMLLGAEIFFDIWANHQLKLQNGLPSLNETLFGWVLAGKLGTSSQLNLNSNATFCGCVAQADDLSDQVKKFWELESCEIKQHLTPEERKVEEHFIRTVRRQSDGRYVVQIPVKPSVVNLGDSRQMAMKRFIYLERKLSRDVDLKNNYTSFINEYLSLDHMQPSPSPSKNQDYHIINIIETRQRHHEASGCV
jgi:Putative peptidase (DUF1758)